jgi:hypothetical protein
MIGKEIKHILLNIVYIILSSIFIIIMIIRNIANEIKHINRKEQTLQSNLSNSCEPTQSLSCKITQIFTTSSSICFTITHKSMYLCLSHTIAY